MKRLVALVMLMCSIAGALVSCVPKQETVMIDELRGFTSVGQLEAWLAADDTDEQIYVEETHDCDDFAIDLQKAGIADGYLINLEFIVTEDVGHVCNAVIIGNEVYFIEPQSDEVWLVGFVDLD